MSISLQTRNCQYIRVNDHQVLRVQLNLKNEHREWFSDGVMQLVLAELQPKILKSLKAAEPDKTPVIFRGTYPPSHFCFASLSNPIVFPPGPNFQMSYFFQPLRFQHAVLQPVAKSPFESDSALTEDTEAAGDDENGAGGAGRYRSFTPLKVAIVVTVAPPENYHLQHPHAGGSKVSVRQQQAPADTPGQEDQELEDFFTQLDQAYVEKSPPAVAQTGDKRTRGSPISDPFERSGAGAGDDTDEELLLPLRKGAKGLPQPDQKEPPRPRQQQQQQLKVQGNDSELSDSGDEKGSLSLGGGGGSGGSFDSQTQTQTVAPELLELYATIEPDLKRIFKGDLKSWRRENFLKGGKARDSLKYEVGFASLKESEMEHLSAMLTNTFCNGKQRLRYYSFVMDVLLAEAVIRITAVRQGISLEEAEALMKSKSPTLGREQLANFDRVMKQQRLSDSQLEGVEKRLGLQS